MAYTTITQAMNHIRRLHRHPSRPLLPPAFTSKRFLGLAMFTVINLLSFAVGTVLTVVLTIVSRLSTPKAPLPPGPPPRGLAGNIHQITTTYYWKLFKTWSETYGPIVYYRIYWRKAIVLNDFKSATDLLETRSSKYSDRPHSWMFHELIGRKMSVFSTSSQHERFKTYRKLLHSGLNARAVDNYYPLLREETETLLQGLAEAPQNFISHFRRNSGAVILKIAYGWTVTENGDRFVRMLEEAFALANSIIKTGKWMVDFLPILRFVPPWFPGAGFQNQAAEFKKELSKVDQIPFQWAKTQIDSGDYIPSFVSRYLVPEDGHKVTDEEQDTLRWCAGALYEGAADTTVAFMTAFVAAMTMYPEAQERAQKEIDAHLEREQAPKPADQASLPYVSALIREIFRWAPPAPMGIPHRVIEEDIYNGYRIPAGASVIANIWAICRDPSLYRDPLEFNPERFISSEGRSAELDPRKVVFGFGRRACPGAQFAESSVFINVVSILKRFKIEKAIDADDVPITPTLEFTAAVVSHVKPFPCLIKERYS